MRCAGLDVGSRTTKLVVLNDGDVYSQIVETGVNPLRRSQEILGMASYELLVVTGYGRHLVAPAVGAAVVSEITAHAVGARRLYPDCGAIINVGGQDSKAIQLSPDGSVQRFEMNDRCAAGTGKFLEVMANTLEVDIDSLGGLAMSTSWSVRINSLCTVFAESEVVSLIARGEEPGAIALALHEAIATRVNSMARRIGPLRGRVVFSGGVARNASMRRLLSRELGLELSVPEDPQSVGALGAAVLAMRMERKNSR